MTVAGRLWRSQQTQTDGGLDDLDIVSECADHLEAGLTTTSSHSSIPHLVLISST